ncbi:MAG: hypothetical protein PWP64_1539 [Candidatus Cloacimonadota bacterium]|nr:hypothetical protein [Candidatus Cloacimonadota bacterium]
MNSVISIGSLWRLWDLHLHSTASDGSSSPEDIILKAKELGISVVALTDHHTARNIDEIRLIGQREGISVLAGIEFRTEYGNKSVHIIGLFPEEYNNHRLDARGIHDLILAPLNVSEAKIIAKGREINPQANDDEAFKDGLCQVQVDFKGFLRVQLTKTGEIPPPAATQLFQNYPNPFNPVTSIKYDLAENSRVRMDIYNVKGQLVKTLLNQDMLAGTHSVIWDGNDDKGRAVSSGVYFYRMTMPNKVLTNKMLLLK